MNNPVRTVAGAAWLAVVGGALALGTACSQGFKFNGAWDSGGASTATSGTSETGTMDVPAPEWRTWRGSVFYDGLDWVLSGDAASVVNAVFWLDGAEVCSVEVTVSSAAAGAFPAGPTLYAWWDLAIERPSDRPDCPGELPAALGVGIGALDPELLPPLADLDLDGSTLFGLYVQEDGGPVWVLGVAGTAEQWAGAAPAPDIALLPAGAYAFEGLFLIRADVASGDAEPTG